VTLSPEFEVGHQGPQETEHDRSLIRRPHRRRRTTRAAPAPRTFGIGVPRRAECVFQNVLFMSLFPPGRLEIGLIFSLVALGVLISFRILVSRPDRRRQLPLGGAVAAT
jgi:hypothetical protein